MASDLIDGGNLKESVKANAKQSGVRLLNRLGNAVTDNSGAGRKRKQKAPPTNRGSSSKRHRRSKRANILTDVLRA